MLHCHFYKNRTLHHVAITYRVVQNIFFSSTEGERKLCDSIFPSLLSVHFDSIPFSSHTTHIRFRFTEQNWKHEKFFIKLHIHSAIVSKRWSLHFWSLCSAYTHTISATSSTPIYCNSFILFHFIFYKKFVPIRKIWNEITTSTTTTTTNKVKRTCLCLWIWVYRIVVLLRLCEDTHKKK